MGTLTTWPVLTWVGAGRNTRDLPTHLGVLKAQAEVCADSKATRAGTHWDPGLCLLLSKGV